MARRSKKPRDTNSMAAAIVQQATDPDDHGDDPYEGKDREAVDRGREGGKRGGQVRAERLSPETRSAIARKAAQARWAKKT